MVSKRMKGNVILKKLRGKGITKNEKNKKCFWNICNIIIISIVRDYDIFKGWGNAPLLILDLNLHFN